MTRLIALGTLSLVMAFSLVVVPLVSAQTTNTDQTYTTTNTTNTTGTSTDTGTTDTSTTTPGLPNTGLGGSAALNLGILLTSGLVVLGGVALLARRRLA
jgi:hypothetical protein